MDWKTSLTDVKDFRYKNRCTLRVMVRVFFRRNDTIILTGVGIHPTKA